MAGIAKGITAVFLGGLPSLDRLVKAVVAAGGLLMVQVLPGAEAHRAAAGAIYTCARAGYSFAVPPTWRAVRQDGCDTVGGSSDVFFSTDRRAGIKMYVNRAMRGEDISGGIRSKLILIEKQYDAGGDTFTITAHGAKLLAATRIVNKVRSTFDLSDIGVNDTYTGATFYIIAATSLFHNDYYFYGHVVVAGNRSVSSQINEVLGAMRSTTFFTPVAGSASQVPSGAPIVSPSRML